MQLSVPSFQLLPTFHLIWLVAHHFHFFYLHFILWCHIWLEFSFWLAPLEFICGLFCQIYFWPFHHSSLARAGVAHSAFSTILHCLSCGDGVPVPVLPPLLSHGALEFIHILSISFNIIIWIPSLVPDLVQCNGIMFIWLLLLMFLHFIEWEHHASSLARLVGAYFISHRHGSGGSFPGFLPSSSSSMHSSIALFCLLDHYFEPQSPTTHHLSISLSYFCYLSQSISVSTAFTDTSFYPWTIFHTPHHYHLNQSIITSSSLYHHHHHHYTITIIISTITIIINNTISKSSTVLRARRYFSSFTWTMGAWSAKKVGGMTF